MSGFWMLVLGIGLSVLGVAVALWDIWLTLKVNSNVTKGFNMEEKKGAKPRSRTAPEAARPSISLALQADTSEDPTPARPAAVHTVPQPRAVRAPSPFPATPGVKAHTATTRPPTRPAPAVAATQPRAVPVAAYFAPIPTTFPDFPKVRRHGYRPCEYRDATPSLGEGHKLLKRGMDHVRAGNTGLALSLLYPSLQIFSQGASTRGEAIEAWRAIQNALESTPTLYRRQTGFTTPAHPPKAGLYSF